MVLAGQAVCGEQLPALRTHIEQGDFTEDPGDYLQADAHQQHIVRTVSDVNVKLSRPMEIAIDCGHGVAGAFAPAAFPCDALSEVALFLLGTTAEEDAMVAAGAVAHAPCRPNATVAGNPAWSRPSGRAGA